MEIGTVSERLGNTPCTHLTRVRDTLLVPLTLDVLALRVQAWPRWRAACIKESGARRAIVAQKHVVKAEAGVQRRNDGSLAARLYLRLWPSM